MHCVNTHKHVPRMPEEKVAFSIPRNLFCLKKPSMNDNEFYNDASTFYNNNESQLHADFFFQELKNNRFFAFFKFVHNYVGNTAMKETKNMFSLTHDERLKDVNHEGVGGFQSLLKHWKSDHAMKNPELCWKRTC